MRARGIVVASPRTLYPAARNMLSRMNRTFSGIDLAADPAKTGTATIQETPAGLTLIDATASATDAILIELVTGAELTGVDVPVGWPRAFREFVCAHADQRMAAPATYGPDERRRLVNRFTDLEVRRNAGVTPLPVAAERIAHPALRWAGVESRLRAAGANVDRAGRGRVAEVYPAAALKQWGLRHRGYKGADAAGRGAREKIAAGLTERFELDWAGREAGVVDNADCLDAVIAALVAREVRAGRCIAPPSDQAELVAEEGWVWVPRPSA